MMKEKNLFGTFLRDKRIKKGLSLRELALQINLSHSYLSCIESGKKQPPSNKILIELADALTLDSKSKQILFDFAVQTKENNKNDYNIPADISKYLFETVEAKNFIREADRQSCSNEFWNEILQQLKNKNISQ